MGLRGKAAIVGYTELPSTKRPPGPLEFNLEQWARLAASTIADAGLDAADVDGICTGHLQESHIFVPSTIIEYLGIRANSPSSSISVGQVRPPWCGELLRRSSSVSAMPCCAWCPRRR